MYIFDYERWRDDCKRQMKRTFQSERNVSSNLHISNPTFNRIMRGKKEPTMSDFIQICAVLKLDAINYFDEDEVQRRMF